VKLTGDLHACETLQGFRGCQQIVQLLGICLVNATAVSPPLLVLCKVLSPTQAGAAVAHRAGMVAGLSVLVAVALLLAGQAHGCVVRLPALPVCAGATWDTRQMGLGHAQTDHIKEDLGQPGSAAGHVLVGK